MAIDLSAKPNTLTPNATYPYGNILDDTGANDGTPINALVYADFHQFFAKLLDNAGITANGLPDNFTNGFEYFDALIATETTLGLANQTNITENSAQIKQLKGILYGDFSCF